MYYVYILQNQSNDRDIYIGSTSDLKRRLKEHNRGDNKSTRGREWKILYYEAYQKETTARERERKLKSHGRSKQLLIERVTK